MNGIPEKFFVAGGALRYDAPSYVERGADRQLRELAASGELCTVLTTRQMGKSSLMVRTAAHLRSNHIHTAIIDLTSIGRAPIDQWFLSLLDDLQAQLPLQSDAETWWEAHVSLSPVKRFTKFIQEVIPNEVEGRVAIFIDEIDSMLNLEFADDFFAAIRSIYNKGASLPFDYHISFVLLGVAAPNDLITDQSRTPFNVGRRIRLEEFSLEQAGVLLRGLPGESQDILERIFYWTNGHPYLTQKVGLAIARESDSEWSQTAVDQLVQRMFLTDAALNQESNLQFVRSRLLGSPNKEQLLSIYRRILDGRQIANNEQSALQNELKLYGLIKSDPQNELAIRNRIYRHVFNKQWVKENSPRNKWRLISLGAAAAAVIAIIFSVIVFRQLQQAAQAEDILAETLMANFENTDNPTLRLDNLYQLFALNDYNDEALALFQSLTLDEQIALMTVSEGSSTAGSSTPESLFLRPQKLVLIQQSYTSFPAAELQVQQDSSRLLQTMADTLAQSDDAQSQALHDEIEIWLQGRRYALDANFVAAKIAYDIAHRFNSENPATTFERALAAIQLNEYQAATRDLEQIWRVRPEWRPLVIETVNKNNQLMDFLHQMATPSTFAAAVPSPTASPTAAPTRTTSLQTKQTPSPELEPSPTAINVEPTSTPTALASPQLVTLGRTEKENAIEAVRFGNGENMVVFIGGLQGGYAPGAVDLAQRAILYFSEDPQAVPQSVTLYVIPNANPDSTPDPGNIEARLNGNGVDLNRNWDCRWEADPRIGGEVFPGAGGSEPFSEVEAQALRDFVLEIRPAAAVFWLARANAGVVIGGGCLKEATISNELGQVYSGASRYTFYREDESSFVPGDATNWLTDQGIAAVAVLLPEYERTDWQNNLAGMLAVLEQYR